LYRNVPNIVTNILKNGVQLAIVSRNTSRTCGYLVHTTNPKTGKKRSIVDKVKFNEGYDSNY
ncbi:hypothetical protein PAXINDRAFT_90728, partial [Paxillus involutus ATCC 200175]